MWSSTSCFYKFYYSVRKRLWFSEHSYRNKSLVNLDLSKVNKNECFLWEVELCLVIMSLCVEPKKERHDVPLLNVNGSFKLELRTMLTYLILWSLNRIGAVFSMLIFLLCVTGESVSGSRAESRLGGRNGLGSAARLRFCPLQPSPLRPLHVGDHGNAKGDE